MRDRADGSQKDAFEPVADSRTRLLVLGSLPGDISLARRQYYANPRNQFWRLMEPVVGAKLTDMAYESKLDALLEAGVGLWDVVAAAERKGSLDSAIKAYQANPLETALHRFPSLRTLAFNGGKAYQIGRKQLAANNDVQLIPLPSSSAAYCAMPFEEKRTRWSGLMLSLS